MKPISPPLFRLCACATGGIGVDWSKGQHVGTGQADVKAYNRRLRNLIHKDRAKPSWIVSHELALDEAPDAYRHFCGRDRGWTKVILHPAATPKKPARQSIRKDGLRKAAANV